LPYSPWSEKARWALDHHRIAYEEIEHQLFVGEIRLRILLQKPTGRVSVPLLDDGGVLFTDSFDIARHADAIGAGARLIPAGSEGEVEAWNRKSEVTMSALRAQMVLELVDNPRAAKAALPPAIPEALRPLLVPIARRMMGQFAAKYRMREGAERHQAMAQEGLDALRAALAGGKKYLLGDALSYADITMAIVLQGVSPVDERFMPIGPGGREGWSRPELAARYPDLIAWRDELYKKHRRPTREPAADARIAV
jgi:glutathione S-transferase